MVLNSQVSGKNTRFVFILTGAGAVGRGGTPPLTAAVIGNGASLSTSVAGGERAERRQEQQQQ